jgi:hypothetical protein
VVRKLNLRVDVIIWIKITRSLHLLWRRHTSKIARRIPRLPSFKSF